MSEEDKDTGGEQNEEPTTFSQEDVDKQVEAAKKEGQTDAYRHWQGVADKAIAATREEESAKSSTLSAELSKLKADALEKMEPADRQNAMIEELYADRNKPAPAATKSTSKDDQASAEEKTAKEAQDTVNESIKTAMKAAGIDPDKVDMADNLQGPEALEKFFKSVKAAAGTGAKSDGDDDGEESEEEDDDSNRQSSSASSGKTVDVITTDPLDIMREAPREIIRGKGNRRRM